MTTFGEKFKELRKKNALSQEGISERLGVTSQAISKWECNRSYPDLEMLIVISEFFGVSLDMLLTGKESERIGDDTAENQQILGLPDDENLRIVLCKGNKLLKFEEGCNGVKIPLKITGRVEHIEVRGSATIDGDVHGNIRASASVSCGNVEGSVSAGASVACDNVTGNVAGGCSVSCDNVYGSVAAGASIGCDNIHGDIKQCGGEIHCENVSGNIENCEKVVYIGREK